MLVLPISTLAVNREELAEPGQHAHLYSLTRLYIVGCL